MLEKLSLTNIGLVEHIELEYQQGCTVFTGETGAGKSMMLSALLLLLGEKVSSDVVRRGEKTAEVSALWNIKNNNLLIEWLNKNTLLNEDVNETKTLVMRRLIKDTGRSQCFIHGTLVSLSQLGECTQFLCEVHAQHEHQSLFKEKQQRLILDTYTNLIEEQTQFAQELKMYKRKKMLWQKWCDDKSNLEEKKQYLQYAIAEIQALKLKKDEDVQVSKELSLASHKERIATLWKNFDENISGGLSEDTSAPETKNIQSLYNKTIKDLYEILTYSGDDKTLKKIIERFESLSIELDDIVSEVISIRKTSENIDVTYSAGLESRLLEIELIKKNYGTTLEGVLEFLESAKMQLKSLGQDVDDQEGILYELKNTSKLLIQKADVFHQKRVVAAKKFSKQVSDILHNLAMNSADFQVSISEVEKDKKVLFSHGYDKILFTIRSNKGELHKPIAQIASGGELSRIMLAIRIVGNAELNTNGNLEQGIKNGTQTGNGTKMLVLDEVDAGIGGKTAHLIARYLWELSRRIQIICVSHLPIIASCADRHYYVYKQEKNNRTYVQVKNLVKTQRVQEVARMLVGDENDTLAHVQAEKMLAMF